VLLVIRLSPMAESRLYKIAHCNQAASSSPPLDLGPAPRGRGRSHV